MSVPEASRSVNFSQIHEGERILQTLDPEIQDRVRKTAQRHLDLCAQIQGFAYNDYDMPETLYEAFVKSTEEDLARREEPDKDARTAYAALTHDDRIKQHLENVANFGSIYSAPTTGNNCGLYSLGFGLVYDKDPKSIAQLRQEIESLPENPRNRIATRDRETVQNGLDALSLDGGSIRSWEDKDFNDFMDALARLLRTIGQIEARKQIQAAKLDLPVPNNRDMFSTQELLWLAELLKMKGVCIHSLNKRGELLQVEGNFESPKLIIVCKNQHFTPMVHLKPEDANTPPLSCKRKTQDITSEYLNKRCR